MNTRWHPVASLALFWGVVAELVVTVVPGCQVPRAGQASARPVVVATAPRFLGHLAIRPVALERRDTTGSRGAVAAPPDVDAGGIAAIPAPLMPAPEAKIRAVVRVDREAALRQVLAISRAFHEAHPQVEAMALYTARDLGLGGGGGGRSAGDENEPQWWARLRGDFAGAGLPVHGANHELTVAVSAFDGAMTAVGVVPRDQLAAGVADQGEP